jgi:uncharacterized protein (DUF427 family)
MERVWNYPRPPAVVPCERRVRIELAGEVLADSTRALRVLETSHPPTIYIPLADVREELLGESDAHSTWCEFKGRARYLDAVVHGRRFEAVGWSYPDSSSAYEALRDHVAFYPGRVGAAWLGDERVQAQRSDFYGGWITGDLVGPFKGRSARSPGEVKSNGRSPAAIPEIASVEFYDGLLKHSAAGSMTSRSLRVAASRCPGSVRRHRGFTRRFTQAGAATAALDDLIGEGGEAWVPSAAGQLARFGRPRSSPEAGLRGGSELAAAEAPCASPWESTRGWGGGWCRAAASVAIEPVTVCVLRRRSRPTPRIQCVRPQREPSDRHFENESGITAGTQTSACASVPPKTSRFAGTSQAAEGARILDLLHGKRAWFRSRSRCLSGNE